MCSSVAEGGKRCAVHMCGSRAALKEAEIYTKEDRGVLSKMFTMLRKEGKNLPAPSPEEVRDYADGQRVRARFDSSLSKRDSNTLVRNWTKAREEEPDGGTFHAWKNLRSFAAAQKQRIRRGVAGLGIATSVIAMGACGGPPGNNETPPPTPTPTATEEVTTPAPSQTEGISFEMPPGISTGDRTLSSIHGEYAPLTLAEDSPLRQYNDEVVTSAAKQGFSQGEIEEAQSFTAEFVVNEGIDSVLVYDYSEENAQQWWNDNQHKFAPENRDEFRQNIMNPNVRSIVVDNNAGDSVLPDGEINPDGYWARGNPSYEAGGPRTGNVTVELVEVNGDAGGAWLQFDYNASVSRIVTDPAGEVQGDIIEDTDLDFSLIVSNIDGNWSIYGANNKFTTVNNQP